MVCDHLNRRVISFFSGVYIMRSYNHRNSQIIKLISLRRERKKRSPSFLCGGMTYAYVFFHRNCPWGSLKLRRRKTTNYHSTVIEITHAYRRPFGPKNLRTLHRSGCLPREGETTVKRFGHGGKRNVRDQKINNGIAMHNYCT